MDGRVPPALLEVGKQVTAHLKWPFMDAERTETGPIQSIQNFGAAFLVKVNDMDVFATGLPESPGWFTNYDPPALPRAPRLPRFPAPVRAVTPPSRAPEFKTGETPDREKRRAGGKRIRTARSKRRIHGHTIRKSHR